MQSYQYYPVIIKVGARFIQAGFAGDATPILRTPTNAYDLGDAQLNNTIQFKHCLSSDIKEEDHYFENKLLWTYDLIGCDMTRLESLLERIFYDIYQNNLLVDAKKCKVLIIEPPFFPVPLKKVITKVLLFHIHAQSLRFYPEPVLSTVSAGSNSGLVVDLGWNQFTVTPVYDLRMIYKDIKVTYRAGKVLHEMVYEKLKNVESLPKEGGFDLVERLICEVFYCNTSKTSKVTPEEFQFGDLKIPNRIRYEIIEELMFKENPKGIDNENQLLIPMIKSALEALSIDLRGELSSRIIFTGGVSMIPGIKTRILEELKKVTELPIDAIVSLGSWEGASLYCSTSLMSPSTTGTKRTDELFRDKYLNGESILLDWTDQLYTQQRTL